jgi:asparagine N-glycosylation enzyme membrane subunit Stt3
MIDLSQHIDALIIGMGTIIGFIIAVVVLVKYLFITDDQGQLRNTRFLLTVLMTVIIVVFAFLHVALMILAITIDQGIMASFNMITGVVATGWVAAITSYFKDMAAAKVESQAIEKINAVTCGKGNVSSTTVTDTTSTKTATEVPVAPVVPKAEDTI